MTPYYFYMYNISIYDFSTIRTLKAEIYIFTNKINIRALLPPSFRTGIFTVKCHCPETFRIVGPYGDIPYQL